MSIVVKDLKLGKYKQRYKEDLPNISTWFCLLNPNKAVYSKRDKFIKKFKYVFEVFTQNVPLFVIPYDGNHIVEPDKYHYNVARGYEVGELDHKLHVHFDLTIKHDSKIKLDYDLITKWFTKNLGLKGDHIVYFHATPYNDAKNRIYRYISKTRS